MHAVMWRRFTDFGGDDDFSRRSGKGNEMDRTSVDGLRPCSAQARCADPLGRGSDSGDWPATLSGGRWYLLRLQRSATYPEHSSGSQDYHKWPGVNPEYGPCYDRSGKLGPQT